MLVVTIDFGTYSLKILESRVEKKIVKHFNKFELQIPQARILEKIEKTKDRLAKAKEPKERELKIDETLPALEFQVKLLKQYLEKIPENSKVFIQSPHQLTTSRFINIPINNKKKATQMLPFQIEEDIPFSLNQITLTHGLEKEDKTYNSVSSMMATKTLSDFHNYLKDHDCLPTFMGTETDSWNTYLKSVNEFEDKNIVIIDLGHTNSKLYFFNKKKLTSYTLSSFSGQKINDMLMNEYNVHIDKATEFKHKNSFYLTPEQYADVDQKQREFASKMNSVTQTLINDFKRWELSLRVNHSEKIDEIFICGGCAKIKNIENYLAQSFGHKVNFAKDWNKQFISLPIERFDFLNLANANSLSNFYLNRQQANNFLTGDFSPVNTSDFPIHSISYVSVRAFLLLILLIGGFSLEKYFIQKKDKAMTKNLQGTLSQPVLGLTKREVAIIKRRPDVILKKLNAKIRNLRKTITTVEKSSDNQSLIALFNLSEKVRTNCFISQYADTYDGEVEATFSGCASENILELEKSIQAKKLKSMTLKSNPNQGTLKLKFQL